MSGELRAAGDCSMALLFRADLSGGNDTSYLLCVFCTISIPHRVWRKAGLGGVAKSNSPRGVDDVNLSRGEYANQQQ